MIKKWFEKREVKEQRKAERDKQTRRKYRKVIEEQKEIMLNTPCALRPEFGHCSDQCIHFLEGKIYREHSFSVHTGVHEWTTYSLPRCRLWKE